MDGHDLHRPIRNARAEIGASESPAPFREAPPSFRDPREPVGPRRLAASPEPIAAPSHRGAEAVVEVPTARMTPPTNPPAPLPPAPPALAASSGVLGPRGQQPQAATPVVRHDDPGVGHPPLSGPGPMSGHVDHGDAPGFDRGATAPQLRRFIKSRAYVPIHELRRRFGLNGEDDDVTPVDIGRTRVFVGLPDREGRLLGELLRAGDIGYELSMDPVSPIVVGVYPMRPVTRN